MLERPRPFSLHTSIEEEIEGAFDSAIKEIFGEFNVEDIGMTPSLGEIAKALKSKREVVAEIQAKVKQVNDQKLALLKQIEEMSAAVRKMRQEANDLDLKKFDLAGELRAARREVASLEEALKLEIDKLRQSQEFSNKAKEFTEITADAPWRSKAFKHQVEGAQILALAKRGICADKRGLGKSLLSLIWLDMLKAKKVLIVCPADVVSNFEEEVLMWCPSRAPICLYKLDKNVRQSLLASMKMLDEFVLLTNYEVWRKDPSIIESINELQLDTVILDEAHTIKETATSAYKGCKNIILATNSCPACGGHAPMYEVSPKRSMPICTQCAWSPDVSNDHSIASRQSVKNVLLMTGTPILNRPQELYPLLSLILPDVFYEKSAFLNTYCIKGWDNYWRFIPGAFEGLKAKLAGHYIGRNKEDAGIVTPEQRPIVHTINLEEEKDKYPQQYKIIRDLHKHAAFVLESGRQMTVLAAIALITRERQANVWPGGISWKDDEGNVIYKASEEITESIKIDRAIALIDEAMESGERVVVFSQFKEPLREIDRRLKATHNAADSVVFDGSTSEATRRLIKTDFDRRYCDAPGYKKKWDVVLCNYKTGGVGLNFNGATQMIILDEEWNPGKIDQAYGRIDRIGQTQKSEVHILRIARTIDDWLQKLIKSKEGVTAEFELGAHDLADNMLQALRNGELM